MDMSWREFRLRRIAYDRSQKKEWYKVREISYWSAAGTAIDVRKTSIDKFMDLEEKEVVSIQKDHYMDHFLKEHEDYMKKANVGEDGRIERRDWS
ncbi:hypothetical protein CMV04_12215 [Elizabethkingia anophelis]|nr:hypothetical protein [Elizabethkingia anophelis]